MGGGVGGNGCEQAHLCYWGKKGKIGVVHEKIKFSLRLHSPPPSHPFFFIFFNRVNDPMRRQVGVLQIRNRRRANTRNVSYTQNLGRKTYHPTFVDQIPFTAYSPMQRIITGRPCRCTKQEVVNILFNMVAMTPRENAP